MIKERIARLINVKTIVTLIFVIFYQAFIGIGIIPSNGYEDIVKMIVIFYFGTQVGKAEAKKEDENE